MQEEEIRKCTNMMTTILRENMVINALSICVETKEGQVTDIRMERNHAYDDWNDPFPDMLRSDNDDGNGDAV